MKKIPVFKVKGFRPASLALAKEPLRIVVEQSKKLGRIFRVPLFFKQIYVISDVAIIKQILQTNQKNYRKSAAYKQLKLALGNGLVTSEGDFWRRQRRMAQPAFYKTQLEELFNKMILVSEQFCEDLSQRIGKDPINISQEMMMVTANIVLKALFSTEKEQDKAGMAENAAFGQAYIINRARHPSQVFLSYFNGKKQEFDRRMKGFDADMIQIIEERRQLKEQPIDLLSLLLQATDEDSGEGMSNRQLRDELVTIYAAGHETSSNALSWTLYLLAQHPAILHKLRQEINQVLGNRSHPNFADLRSLQYTRQVLEESMRLYPPAYAVGRENIAADEFHGHKIPAKSVLVISIYALHRDEEYYPNPEQFDPDRFAPNRVKERPKLAYMPFGAGPRMCIGNHFAMMEMQLLLAMFVQRFDFKLLNKERVIPQPLVTLSPKGGMMMQLRTVVKNVSL
jgi:cytochrome P450